MRNFFDYTRYVFSIRKKEQLTFMMNVVLFIIAIQGLIQEWCEVSTAFRMNRAYILLIIGSIFNFLWSLYGIYGEYKQQSILKYGVLRKENIAIGEIEPSSVEKLAGFEKELCGNTIICEINANTKCSKMANVSLDYVMYSKQINQYLINHQDLKIEENKAKEQQVKTFIRANKERLLPFLTWQYRISKFYGKLFFNDQKLCLSEDITMNEQTIKCHKGGYYDTFLTNQICGKHIQSTNDDTVIVDATNDFPIEKKGNHICLLEVTKSEMNNEIGISTIGITSDNYMVFWKQNVQAQSSEGLLVPTGSGSCDWIDLAANRNFHQTLTGAMQRELCEESMGKGNYLEIGDTYLIGFFRWTIKGGKPEFVGVTKMNISYTEIQGNKKEVYKGKAVRVDSKEELVKQIDEMFKEKLSTPLYMNLLCLKECMESMDEGSIKIQRILFD